LKIAKCNGKLLLCLVLLTTEPAMHGGEHLTAGVEKPIIFKIIFFGFLVFYGFMVFK